MLTLANSLTTNFSFTVLLGFAGSFTRPLLMFGESSFAMREGGSILLEMGYHSPKFKYELIFSVLLYFQLVIVGKGRRMQNMLDSQDPSLSPTTLQKLDKRHKKYGSRKGFGEAEFLFYCIACSYSWGRTRASPILRTFNGKTGSV